MLRPAAFCEHCQALMDRGQRRFCTRECAARFQHAKTASRFWEKVTIGADNECWEWQGYRTARGYGRTSYLGKTGIRAHRLALILKGEVVAPSLMVLHSCDNPPCCNPAHLSLGTALDNNRDMIQRGRARHATKLTADDVAAIRAATGTLKGIAQQFGVSFSHVGGIRRGLERCA